MTYPSPAKVNVTSDRVVKVTTTRPKAYYSRGGTQSLEVGVREFSVAFTTPLKDANWVFGALTFWNIVDARLDIVQLSVTAVTAKSQSGFTVLLAAPPPTGSYNMDWTIAEAYNP